LRYELSPFSAFYGTGYPRKEIAAFPGIPSGAVKQRLYDGRQRLRGKLPAALVCLGLLAARLFSVV
jgi:DNA-directed RNA polymerase specialized sigma24 family protein